MAAVVEADAEDFIRIGNGRQVFDLLRGDPRAFHRLQRPEPASGQQLSEAGARRLRQQVETELNEPRATRPTTAASSRVLGCVHLLAGSDPLELVQSVQFEGRPATIIAARTGQGYTAWVAGPDCSATNREVLDTITLPSGISAP